MAMRILTKMLKQTGVYWASPTSDGRGGTQTSFPVEIDCRWEDMVQEIKDDEGKIHISKALVYTDREVDVGGFLYKGTLASLNNDINPSTNRDAHIILKYGEIPTLSASQVLRSAWL